jgi:hypothetical protein
MVSAPPQLPTIHETDHAAVRGTSELASMPPSAVQIPDPRLPSYEEVESLVGPVAGSIRPQEAGQALRLDTPSPPADETAALLQAATAQERSHN